MQEQLLEKIYQIILWQLEIRFRLLKIEEKRENYKKGSLNNFVGTHPWNLLRFGNVREYTELKDNPCLAFLVSLSGTRSDILSGSYCSFSPTFFIDQEN